MAGLLFSPFFFLPQLKFYVKQPCGCTMLLPRQFLLTAVFYWEVGFLRPNQLCNSLLFLPQINLMFVGHHVANGDLVLHELFIVDGGLCISH